MFPIDNPNRLLTKEEFIQKQADEKGVTFDEMVEIIENELKPKQ
jgi:hypothetical protein